MGVELQDTLNKMWKNESKGAAGDARATCEEKETAFHTSGEFLLRLTNRSFRLLMSMEALCKAWL